MITSTADLLLGGAAASPSAAFLTFLDGAEETSLTYAELLDSAGGVAAWLDEMAAGDHVLLIHPNGPAFFADFFGTLLSGRVPVPVAPPTHLRHPDGYAEHVRLIAERCDARTLLTTATHEAGLVSLAAAAGLRMAVAVPSRAPVRYEPVPPGELAFLQFTSGSTTRPRGVRVTHANVLENVTRIRENFEFEPASVACSWLPLFHDMGLIGTLSVIASGARLVLMTPNSFLRRPVRWLEAISRFGATHTATPCFGLDHLLGRMTSDAVEHLDLRSVRHLSVGSDMIGPSTLQRFCDAVAPTGFDPEALRPAYGLAESTLLVSAGRGVRTASVSRRALQSGLVSHAADDDDTVSLVACGQALAGHRIEIIGVDGHPVAPGVEGEIVIHGPSIADGYHDELVLTAEVFRQEPDGSRCVRTSDLGFLLEGQLYVSGRAKDMLIVRGRNIHPEDVEAMLVSKTAARTGAVAVVSVVAADGEGLAVIKEVRGDRETLADLADSIVQLVIDSCEVRPAQVVFVPLHSLPRTSSGKLQRALCGRLLREGRLRTIEPTGAVAVRP